MTLGEFLNNRADKNEHIYCLLNIKGVRVKEFRNMSDDLVNEFLSDHDGNIIDIRYEANKWGTNILVVYKED